MDSKDESYFKTKYYQYKIRIKKWESNFINKYGRKPNKNDIKAADSTIREAYKIYWEFKIKTENRSQEATTTYHNIKESTPVEKSHFDLVLSKENQVYHSTELSPILNSIDPENTFSSNIYTSDVESYTPFFENKSNSKQAWDHHLNTEKNNRKENESKFASNSSFQLSQERFKSLNLLKRNPRKLAIHSKLDDNTENSNKNFKEINLYSKNSDESIKTDTFKIAEWTKPNLKVISLRSNVTSKSSNTLQQLILRSSNDSPTNNRLLSKSWLDRCTEPSIDKSLATKLEEPKEEDSCMLYSSTNSDDDYVFNSDSKDHSNKRVRNHNNLFGDEYVQNVKKICCENNLCSSNDMKNLGKKLHDSHEYNKFITDSYNFIKVTDYTIDTNIIKTNNKVNENITFNDSQYTSENSSTVSMTEIIGSNQFQFDRKSRIDSKKLLNINNTNSKEYSDTFPQMPITDISEVIKPSITLTKSNQMIEDTLIRNNSAKELNRNFLRINLKKKVFVRGKKSFNFSTYKKTQWKKKKEKTDINAGNLDFLDSIDKNNTFLCFKCGKMGHLARRCKNSKDSGLAIDDHEEMPDISQLRDVTDTTKLTGTTESKFSINEMLDNYELPEACKEKKIISRNQGISPLYSLNRNGSIIDAPSEVLTALAKFGHKQFRDGQEISIMRTLSGLPTLVTLTTGSGKSLCYQLPAYLYAQRSKCITLVISPLVSLMDDQISKMPDFLPAACLHTNQSPMLHANILNDLKAGKITILLVSPEALAACDTSKSYVTIFRHLPPIAFACIDEAHCISQWSHNFRPSYLMLCKILREHLNVKNILALTATASKYTVSSIIDLLQIKDEKTGVISDKPLPSNLNLTISHDKKKEDALISLLQSERFIQYNSIIIYCTRREECSRIAGLLRICLKDENFKLNHSKRNEKNISAIAEAYHAGLSAHRRKSVYTAFMKSKIRIIVATVAFGMGINKPDIRSVIHYNMPSNFESYVQEIGRAGRDGSPAHCHLFLNAQENSDECELRRHINADGIDRRTIRHLLKKIFIPCNCKNLSKADTKSRCQGHEVAFSVEDTVTSLDIKQETIATLLCYLELYFQCFVKLLPTTYINARIHSYDGLKDLISTVVSSPPLEMAITLLTEKGIYQDSLSTIEFPVIHISSLIGLDSGFLKNQLKRLEWKKGK
ncbi:ATP-dependent DNA helicase Q4, partial [Nasonia vitripennis]|uniref:DNA 3'-5' helicase n=1 Tax=Nasonia vitripennis TaxID=7425 RepID=A0A7M7PUG4_NASVI